jgi:DNA-binding NarL/FixJ family response regulator
VTVRVLIVDDEALVRVALREVLSTGDDVETIGEAEDGEAAVRVAERLRPQVVLMDIRMPRLNGIVATARIAALDEPTPRVLLLTTYDLDEYVYDGLCAGATGFLLKDSPPTMLLHAVAVVARGESVLAPTVTTRLVETFRARHREQPDIQAARGRTELLTGRERAVLDQLVLGRTNHEIAEALGISRFTVKVHVSNVLAKLELRDRGRAMLLGRL